MFNRLAGRHEVAVRDGVVINRILLLQMMTLMKQGRHASFYTHIPSSNLSLSPSKRTHCVPNPPSSTFLTHQYASILFISNLAPMTGPQNILLLDVARTYNFCQLPRDSRKRSAKPPQLKHRPSSIFPRLFRTGRRKLYLSTT